MNSFSPKLKSASAQQVQFIHKLLVESYFVNMILYNRWFCVEKGNADNPSVILIHGFPSQVSILICVFVFDETDLMTVS
jgi:hypothetical protein